MILQKLYELNILMYEKYGSDNADRQYVNANGIANQLWNPDKSGEKHKDLSAILAFQDVHNQACMTWRYEKRSCQSKVLNVEFTEVAENWQKKVELAWFCRSFELTRHQWITKVDPFRQTSFKTCCNFFLTFHIFFWTCNKALQNSSRIFTGRRLVRSAHR